MDTIKNAANMTAAERRAAAMERAAHDEAERKRRDAEWSELKERRAAVQHRYTIIITAEGDAVAYTLWTDSAKAAHEHAEQTAAVRGMTAAVVRVYYSIVDADGELCPYGMERAALYVAKKTIQNATKRGGRENEYIMERELCAATARAAMRDDDTSINEIVAEYGQDTRDMYSAAMVGLAEGYATKNGESYRGILNGGNTESAYHAAFLALNGYVQSLRTASAAECSTEYIMDGHGDLISIGTAMARLLRQGDKYAPVDGGNMDAETAAKLGARLSAVFGTLSPVQADIVRRLSRGMSMSDIARQTGRNKSTISRNVAIIRARFAEGLKGTQFEVMNKSITSVEYTDADGNTQKMHVLTSTEERAAAALDTVKRTTGKHSAEYYRAYRARKAAEKAAQGAAE